MGINKLSKVKFGKTSFIIEITDELKDYVAESEISDFDLVPTLDSWYKQVLYQLDTRHDKEQEIEVVFYYLYDVKNRELLVDSVKEVEDFDLKLNSPVRKKEKEYLTKFAARTRNEA